ncbi:MAG: hypothetical protein ABGY75_18700 [Gemmataceae bacterium]
MHTIRLTELDAVILWCLPQPGCDLPYLVWMYTFCNRAAAPGYAELDGCLRRSIQIGALRYPETGHYQLTPEWYERVHQWDEQFKVPEDGMIEFSDWLPTQEWPVVCPRVFILTPEEYERATAGRPRRG